MRYVLMILAILCGPSVMVFAETVNTVYVAGKAPIIVDGDLLDWNQFNVAPIKLTKFNEKYFKSLVNNPVQ